MKTRNLLSAIALLFLSMQAGAQTTKLTKLEIKAKEVYIVGPENSLIVDTLIMHDKATIQFSPEQAGVLKANVSYIGNKCIITSRGANGTHSTHNALGTAGQHGGNLAVTLNLQKLGSLTIDSRGGKGGNGSTVSRDLDIKGFGEKETKKSDGRTSKEITTIPTGFIRRSVEDDRSDATTGLNGGNGGNIEFTYSTTGFIPVFNNAKAKHSITLLHMAGEAGKNGIPSKAGRYTTDGKLLPSDGKLIQLDTPEAVDGELRLVNVNGISVQE